MTPAQKDWNPGAYARFRGLRLRPALDLLAQVSDLPPGDVIDLGCGDGAAAGALTARFADRWIVGVDNSPAMLDKATGYAATQQADIAAWLPDTPPALIFSNAVLHWLPDHEGLMPRLARLLAPGGVLAVQIRASSLHPRTGSCATLRRRCSPTTLISLITGLRFFRRRNIMRCCRRWAG